MEPILCVLSSGYSFLLFRRRNSRVVTGLNAQQVLRVPMLVASVSKSTADSMKQSHVEAGYETTDPRGH